MPTDHPRVSLEDVWLPDTAILGERGRGLAVAQQLVRENRLACEAADAAIEAHGGIGYSRHRQFEHHYQHHRRYRITDCSDEIQLRKIAGPRFGYLGRGGTHRDES